MKINSHEAIAAPRTLILGVTAFIALMGTTMFFLSRNINTVLTVAVGALIVSILVLLVLLYLRWRLRRFYGESDISLMEVIRGRPAGVSDPEQLARLDGFAKKFEEGCRKYVEATGLAVSESPWYLLVGESGSGKTEAIRHSGVEFPEGLHEERQGAGGTTNMDWWFTEQAIILDTAGRFAIDPNGQRPAAASSSWDSSEDAESDVEESASTERERLARQSTQREWELFLQRVVKARPHCPINGLLLVIPATSLLKDSLEQINSKAEELSKFFSTVRQSLAVRFPVFVLITKSDLIPGFREFFSHINDPELSQQMLGWSKAGSLDEPFDPEEIDEYLEEVRAKLERRRLSLIIDPVHSQLPGSRRIEQVDALYTFPERFSELAPKLRRYLGRMFVRSKFNQSPLFLRGIYFTSSMEHGAAIDTALAGLRGVSLKQLERQGVGYRRERAVFLRDVFMQKIFCESRLVTRESNTDHIRRRRQLWTIGAAGAAAVMLIGFAIAGWQTIMRNVGRATFDWANVSTTYVPNAWNFFKPISRTEPLAPPAIQWDSFNGQSTTSITAFFGKQIDRGQSEIKTPWIYAPVSALLFSPEKERERTIDFLLGRHLAQNVLETAQTRLRTINGLDKNKLDELDAAPFQKDGSITQSAVQLHNLAKYPAKNLGQSPPDLGRVLEFCIQPLDGKPLSQSATLEEARRWLKQSISSGESLQNLQQIVSDAALSDSAATAVGNFWSTRLDERAAERRLKPLSAMKAAMARWVSAFSNVKSQIPEKPLEQQRDYEIRHVVLRSSIDDMKKAAQDADVAWADLCRQTDKRDIQPMLDWLSQKLSEDKNAALSAIAEVTATTETPSIRQQLDDASKRITSRKFAGNELVAEAGLGDFQQWARNVRARAPEALPMPHYRVITNILADLPVETRGSEGNITVVAQLKRVQQEGDGLIDKLTDLIWAGTITADQKPTPRLEFPQPHPLEKLYVNVLAPNLRNSYIKRWLDDAPKSSAQFGQHVRTLTQTPIKPVMVRLSEDYSPDVNAMPDGWQNAADYNPAAAAAALAEWNAVREVLGVSAVALPTTAPQNSVAIVDRAALADSASQVGNIAVKYASDYCQFWFDRRPKTGKWDTWSSLYADLVNAPAKEVAEKANARIDQCTGAINAIVTSVDKAQQQEAAKIVDTLNNLRVDEKTIQAQTAWEKLPNSEVPAVGVLTNGKAEDCYKTYFAAVAERPGGFHYQLFMTAADLLSSAALKLKNANLQALNPTLARFPFNSDAVNRPAARGAGPARPLPGRPLPLSVQEMTTAAGALRSAAKTFGTAVPLSAAFADPSFVKDEEMKRAILKLYSAGPNVQPLLDASKLADLLLDNSVKCELTITKFPEGFPFIAIGESVFVNGRPAGGVPPSVSSEGAQPPNNVIPVRAGGAMLQLSYSQFAVAGLVGTPDPFVHPWKLMEWLNASEYAGKGKEFLWPAAGREVVMKLPNNAEIKFKVVFKKNNIPIEFPFPLPPPG